MTALYVSSRPRRGGVETLRRFVARTVGDLAVDAIVREGDAAPEILACARERGADLIVLGTHSRRPVVRWLLGSVTQEVARLAECAVLAVPWGLDTSSVLRVVCAVDLSASSAETLAQAASAAQALQARLVVLHVVDGPHGFEPWTLSGMTEAEAREALCVRARTRLADLVAPHVRAGLSVEVRVEAGETRAIVERSLHGGVDLAVLGLRPSRKVDRFFYGSTVAHVLHAAVCPVLLIRHGPIPSSRTDTILAAEQVV